MRRAAILLLVLPALLGLRSAPGRGDTVSLRRGPCFGNCPVYEVVLRGDGTASYSGGDYAPREGRYEGRVNPEAVADLLDQLDEADFWSMQVDRQLRVMDLPEIVVTAERRGRRHQVHSNLPPRSLEPIQLAIDSLSRETEWLPVQSPRRRGETR